MAAREGAVNAKRAGLCQLRDLLITTPEPLRSELRPLTQGTAARPARRDAARRRHDPELRGSLLALQSRRPPGAATDEGGARARPRDRDAHPQPRTAAPRTARRSGRSSPRRSCISWSHPGRLASEAAFARLAGVAPIPASSGQTIRYRLDRSGDRLLSYSKNRSNRATT